MALRQLSMSNVTDFGSLYDSVPYFVPCLSANIPTARTFGATILAVNYCRLHDVTRVPFLSAGNVSAYTPSSLALFESLSSVAAPFVIS